MNNFLSRSLRNVTLVAAFGLTAIAAHADLVKYNFNVTVDPNGPLHSQSFDGKFSFDNNAGSLSGGAMLYTLSSFEFKLNGTMYGLADLDPDSRYATFGGTVFTGLDLASAGLDPVGNPLFSFLSGFGGLDPLFTFSLPGVGTNEGGFSATLDTNGTVPEPESLALVLGGLGLLAWTRRRNRSAPEAATA